MGNLVALNFLVSEQLFYGGIGVMGLAAVAALVCMVVFAVTGKKIRETLEREYGKRKK